MSAALIFNEPLEKKKKGASRRKEESSMAVSGGAIEPSIRKKSHVRPSSSEGGEKGKEKRQFRLGEKEKKRRTAVKAPAAGEIIRDLMQHRKERGEVTPPTPPA